MRLPAGENEIRFRLRTPAGRKPGVLRHFVDAIQAGGVAAALPRQPAAALALFSLEGSDS